MVESLTGRATVIDGRTLWFARKGKRIHLSGIDACELPQWAFDPTRYERNSILKPVPCGAFAKAWLKRLVGNSLITCRIAPNSPARDFATCFVHGRDLAIEMLRVGWAKVHPPVRGRYLAWQRYAMAAGFGMWSTYFLEMDEWRLQASDRSLQRHPIADINLLMERRREISPPFAAARSHKRSDR